MSDELKLKFNTEQGLVLDQALSRYLRDLDDGSGHPECTPGERGRLYCRAQELQAALQDAFREGRRARRSPRGHPEKT